MKGSNHSHSQTLNKVSKVSEREHCYEGGGEGG